MQCLILAGGLGTRMRPTTEMVPKAMIPVAGIPFIDHQLALLARQGVRRVVVSIGYLGCMLRAHVGDGSAWGLDVRFVDEGAVLRGTAGAIRLAADLDCLEAGFLVLYGDSYLPIDLRPLWEASGQGATPVMTVLRNDGQWDRSNVRMDGGLAQYDKRAADPAASGMRHIDYGISVLTRREIIEAIPRDTTADLADLYLAMSRRGVLRAHEAFTRFYEIGSPSGLADLEQYFLAAPQYRMFHEA
jgi:NDP-sugar pyrophosphorylase family protein